jgi:hypothetical protein
VEIEREREREKGQTRVRLGIIGFFSENQNMWTEGRERNEREFQ